MANIHVVLDSTAHLKPQDTSLFRQMTIVPLTVMHAGQEWREDDIENAELFRLVQETGIYPHTSQPSPGIFVETFQRLAADGEPIVVITLSSGLSGTYQSALTAAAMVPELTVSVLDSGTTAIGMVRLGEAALQMAGQGLALPQLMQRLTLLRDATHTMFIPGTLEYLHKGGRIGGGAALLGTILQIKPILYLTGGKVSVLDKVRTYKRAIERMLEEVFMEGEPAEIGVVGIEASEAAIGLRDRLADRAPNVQISLTTGGSVLGTHLGPGLLGIIYRRKTPQE